MILLGFFFGVCKEEILGTNTNLIKNCKVLFVSIFIHNLVPIKDTFSWWNFLVLCCNSFNWNVQ